MQELIQNRELYQSQRDDDSSIGSDSEPSEDNLEANELVDKLPEVDLFLQESLKKTNKVKDTPSPIKIRTD